MEPLVSIIMPAYNRKKVIARAIDSCLNQNYQNLEILVCDDHSTDGTESFIREKYGAEKRVKYFYNEPGKKGANAARNTAIRRAAGTYIAFLDSDDYLLPGSVRVRVEAFQRYKKAGMVYGDAFCQRGSMRVLWKYDRIREKDRRRYLMRELCACVQSTIMVRLDIVKELGYLSEDQHGWTDDGLVVAVGMRYPLIHCGKTVVVIVKSMRCMTSNKRNLYLGCKYLVDKYRDDIIREASVFRYILWRIRLIDAWALAKQQESGDYGKKRFYGNISKLTALMIKPFFRWYFQ